MIDFNVLYCSYGYVVCMFLIACHALHVLVVEDFEI